MPGRVPQSMTRASKVEEEDVKNEIRKYLANNIGSLLKDIDELPLKERTSNRMRLLDYLMPKVQSVRAMETNRQSVSDVLLNDESDDND